MRARPEDVAEDPVPTAAWALEGRTAPPDTELAERLRSGWPIASAAMARIRERTGDRGVELVASGADSERAATGAAVTAGEEHFGALTSPRLGPAELAAEAQWLAVWLALEREHRRLHELTLIDGLTGAWNRRAFDRFLGVPALCDRMSLLVFDIDAFQRFHDEHGHAAGDEILRTAARLAGRIVREGDRVCRIGGDEFAVVLEEHEVPPQMAAEPSAGVLETVRHLERAFARLPSPGRDGLGSRGLTISTGLATGPCGQAGLFERADDRLRRNKDPRSGRGVGTASPAPDAGGPSRCCPGG